MPKQQQNQHTNQTLDTEPLVSKPLSGVTVFTGVAYYPLLQPHSSSKKIFVDYQNKEGILFIVLRKTSHVECLLLLGNNGTPMAQ